MKKVLIIGGNSFTGKHLSSYLHNHGYDIYETSLVPNNQKQTYVCNILHKDEILKILKIVKPDFIIHMAAIAFVGHGKNENFYNINTIGALNLLESVVELKQSLQKLILVSSATVYGNQHVEVLDESLCPRPMNHYGASKYAMESLAKNYFEKLPLIIVRPFNYTGIGQKKDFLIPKIVTHFKNKRTKIELGNLNVYREFNDIDFVCEIYTKLLESNISGEIFNIASNRGIKILDVIEIMQEIAGYKIEIVINSAFIRKDEIKTLTGSNKKLFEAIGHVKQKPFYDTLKEMFEA